MAQVKDPVCGMMIDSESAAGQSTFEGQTYYFCSEQCKKQFDAHPGTFARLDRSPAEKERRPEPR
jgi:YHS domain-containing protein